MRISILVQENADEIRREMERDTERGYEIGKDRIESRKCHKRRPNSSTTGARRFPNCLSKLHRNRTPKPASCVLVHWTVIAARFAVAVAENSHARESRSHWRQLA